VAGPLSGRFACTAVPDGCGVRAGRPPPSQPPCRPPEPRWQHALAGGVLRSRNVNATLVGPIPLTRIASGTSNAAR